MLLVLCIIFFKLIQFFLAPDLIFCNLLFYCFFGNLECLRIGLFCVILFFIFEEKAEAEEKEEERHHLGAT